MNEIVLRDWFWATWDYLWQGGWVMIPMVAASISMWTLIFERWRTYHRLSHDDLESVDAMWLIQGDEVPPTGKGLRSLLVRRFLSARSGRVKVDELVLSHATEKLRKMLRRRLAVIGVLAAVAPLLGLLGTVLGMIQTFEVIAIFGTSNAKAMAGGISVALITTQTGLLVAIPGLFISGSLMRRASRLEGRLDEFALSLHRTLQGAGDGSGPDWPPLKSMEATAS